MQKIILASASPRRKTILELAHINFDILPGETTETFPPDMSPEQVPVHVARDKGIAVRNKDVFKRYEKNIPILAADTIVVLEGKIIGKPANREEAIETLSRLSGKTHQVITGVVISNNHKEVAFHEITEVSFNHLSTESIHYYVDQFKPFDKAGAYAIQEWIGVIGIKSINGDYYNVMGLPVNKVVATLLEHF
jgi:septum formation protein